MPTLGRAPLLTLLAVLALAIPYASAQTITAPPPDEQVPVTSQVAAGAELGFYVPTDDDLDTTVAVGGLVEWYMTPRVSLRGGLVRQYRIGTEYFLTDAWTAKAEAPFLPSAFCRPRL
ncbi:MAG: hypothetical protein AB7O67_07065 [Vicinamibacterales bacterium]